MDAGAKYIRISFSPTNCCLKCVAQKQFDAAESAKKNQTDASSLVELTKNLSLEPQPLQSSI